MFLERAIQKMSGICIHVFQIGLLSFFACEFAIWAAKLVTKKPKRDHVTPLLIQLHWLPIKARIEYKIALLCFKCVNSKAPSYLQQLVSPYQPVRPLRSSNKNLLCVPNMKTKKFGHRTFSFNAATIWNSIPTNIRNIINEEKFKKKLKTHLFNVHLL